MTNARQRLINILWLFMGICSCYEPVPLHVKYTNAKALRSEFMKKRFEYYRPNSPPTVNTFPTIHYNNSFPKAAALGDYNSGRNFDCLLAVDFGWPFEINLPQEILVELNKRGLLNKKAVDIFWVVQPLHSLGDNSDGAVKNITYLKAHGWADPDEPLSYHGTRLKGYFLYGIYDADVDISYEVLLNKLKPFEIHVHDVGSRGAYSPKTAALRLPSDKPQSMAFWSLVIDHENPHKKVRALATLHWLISHDDYKNSFVNEFFLEKEITDSFGKKGKTRRAARYDTIGDYINYLKTKSFLKDSSLVKKLLSLIEVNPVLSE